MLAHARVLGHVFNPLTVYWCHRPDGSAGVRRGRGAQHLRRAALLPAAHRRSAGRADAAKEFYVSPFFPVDGWYRMPLPEPGERLALTVTLHRPDGSTFAASVRGRRRPATASGLLRAAARHPASTAAVSGRIRWQGVRLYGRGLRPQPRPRHAPQEGVPMSQITRRPPASTVRHPAATRDPGRWPDVAAVPDSRVRAAVARGAVRAGWRRGCRCA